MGGRVNNSASRAGEGGLFALVPSSREAYHCGNGDAEGGGLLVRDVVGRLDLEVALDSNVLGERPVVFSQSVPADCGPLASSPPLFTLNPPFSSGVRA